MINPGDKPLVSVVIPARNEGRMLHIAISSLLVGRSRAFPLQVVVVDDASSDGSCESLSQFYSAQRNAQVDVVRLPSWSGIPYARNVGAAVAQGQILFITDANIRFPTGWDQRIWAHIGPHRVLCATIADANSSFRGYGGTLHIPSMAFVWLNDPKVYGGHVPLSPCGGTILSSELFRRTGGYDTAMPVYGAAEPEFSVRLWLAGAEIICVPELVLQHRFRPSSERNPFLEATSLLQVHNYLRLGLLYLDRARVMQMFRHYASQKPRLFKAALARVWSSDVWQRRDLLTRTLPARFSSFVQRFGLTDAYDNLAIE
jgi:glycosyltransferase involved in cell wall biosynthesis